MFFSCHSLFLLLSIASSTIVGMEEEIHCNLYLPIDLLPVALMEGNAKKLSAVLFNPNIHPDKTIHTEMVCLDPFTYLIVQQLPDESKTYECVDILCKWVSHITLPSETKLFTVFHFVKSKNMLDFFITKANITNPKNLLDTYYKEQKKLFLKNYL